MNRGLALLLFVAVATAARAAPAPVPSLGALTTGNGLGFQVFDLPSHKITQFLDRPMQYVAPGSDPHGSGVSRRNLAFDVYFGVRADSTAAWLKDAPAGAIGYLDESNIIHAVATVGSVQAESYFYAPFGYAGNAMVALLKVTNTGTQPVTVDAFANPNFHLGSGSGDNVSADGESITTSNTLASETGPGGGAMIYQPLGGFDKADCSGTAYGRVQMGQDLAGTPSSCSGNDLTLSFQKSLGALAAGQSAWWGVGIHYSPDANNPVLSNTVGAFTTWWNARTPEQLLTDARAEWDAWRTAPPAGLSLSDDERRIWRQSEAVLRMAQNREPWSEAPKRKVFGMIVASLPPGQWHIGWVRDATYAIVALARLGHYAEAKAGLDFFLDAEANKYQSYVGLPYRISVTRYFGDGQEESDWSPDGPNIELDGFGLYLWAARTYVDLSGDAGWLDEQTRYGERKADVLRTLVATPLDRAREASGLVMADTSIWERHWNQRKHYTFTSLAAARGLCDFASLAERVQDPTGPSYAKSAAALASAMRSQLVDPKLLLAGSLEGLHNGRYHDGAVLDAFTWGLIEPGDPIFAGTLDGLAALQQASGGYMRNDDGLSAYDSSEWVFIDLHAAMAMRRAGRTAVADGLLGWVTAQAAANQQLLPELYNTAPSGGVIGAYSGAIPMVGFGAASYVLALADRGGARVATWCSATAPPGDNDGGSEHADAGPLARSDGGCDVAQGPAPAAFVIVVVALVALAALILVIRRR